jgi:hypothetical protein
MKITFTNIKTIKSKSFDVAELVNAYYLSLTEIEDIETKQRYYAILVYNFPNHPPFLEIDRFKKTAKGFTDAKISYRAVTVEKILDAAVV